MTDKDTGFLDKIGLTDFSEDLISKEETKEETSPLELYPEEYFIPDKPLITEVQGHLVMVIDHTLENLPIWMEWDDNQNMFTITYTNGDTDMIYSEIKKEYLANLNAAKRILIVTNSEDDKIAHYIPFIEGHAMESERI